MGPTQAPSGADRTQVGPMLAPWTLLSGSLNTTLYCHNIRDCWKYSQWYKRNIHMKHTYINSQYTYCISVTCAQYKLDREFKKIPCISASWVDYSVFYEYFERKRPCYKEDLLYFPNISHMFASSSIPCFQVSAVYIAQSGQSYI